MEFIQIFNLTLPVQQPAVVIALFGAWLYTRCKYGKSFAEQISSVSFLFVMVWKFSIVLLQLPIVIKAPLSLLYFNGGLYGFWLGLASALFYAYVKKMPTFNTAEAWAFVVAIYPFALSILSNTFTIWHVVQFTGSLLFFIFAKEGLEKALILLLFWQLLFLSGDGRLFSVESLVYISVTVYFIFWRKKT
ncbi:hypothetical protein [Domibacillus epiphyticus]|uniref:Uncharacterized protein n=1 Tax=Domibacillus epiphyticus TaxID=1714355 RepID=A0A1V2ABV7_9BACI|nr:hypothetical protein [Domibacillus epiphyticus]OMP68284.1 hypothetical protein BTO28_03200 [Domibacillus epiphyticus]